MHCMGQQPLSVMHQLACFCGWPGICPAHVPQVFDLMDRDKGGSLGVDEVKQLMDMLGKLGSALGGHKKRFSKWTYWVS